MKKRAVQFKILALAGGVAAASLLAPAQSQACTVCAGAAGETATNAAGHAILFMLGVVFAVLAGIVSVVVTMQRRARKYAESTEAAELLTPKHKAFEV